MCVYIYIYMYICCQFSPRCPKPNPAISQAITACERGFAWETALQMLGSQSEGFPSVSKWGQLG